MTSDINSWTGVAVCEEWIKKGSHEGKEWKGIQLEEEEEEKEDLEIRGCRSYNRNEGEGN